MNAYRCRYICIREIDMYISQYLINNLKFNVGCMMNHEIYNYSALLTCILKSIYRFEISIFAVYQSILTGACIHNAFNRISLIKAINKALPIINIALLLV